jgi:plastocyanin
VRVLLAACFVALTGCRGAGTPPPAVSPAESGYRISIREFKFDPPEIVVPRGATVTWTNFDYTAHTATDGPGEGFNSGDLAYRQTFAHTYGRAGRFPYMCIPHPGMRGVVVVE